MWAEILRQAARPYSKYALTQLHIPRTALSPGAAAAAAAAALLTRHELAPTMPALRVGTTLRLPRTLTPTPLLRCRRERRRRAARRRCTTAPPYSRRRASPPGEHLLMYHKVVY
jgi:hypothetical protein